MLTPSGQQECPLYPTELAFALDVSQANGRPSFNNMRDTVQRLVKDITISESNCPRGARVALTLYNDEVTTVVRFADSMKKRALLQQIEGLQTLQTRKERKLDNAMNFLAQNTFKRVRSGFLMRKVAIFFVGTGSAGQAQALTSAALRLHDSGIATLFLVNREDRALTRALQVRLTKQGRYHKGEVALRTFVCILFFLKMFCFFFIYNRSTTQPWLRLLSFPTLEVHSTIQSSRRL